MNRRFLPAIDQGTTSTRAMLFGSDGKPVASHAVPFRQFYPGNGWVEHDALEIWQAALTCCRKVMVRAPATRIAARCAALKAKGWEKKITAKIGLLRDPYFSATNGGAA